jgi:hypothetical protein
MNILHYIIFYLYILNFWDIINNDWDKKLLKAVLELFWQELGFSRLGPFDLNHDMGFFLYNDDVFFKIWEIPFELHHGISYTMGAVEITVSRSGRQNGIVRH